MSRAAPRAVRVEWPREGYARIVFTRADKHNAWRPQDLEAIDQATEAVADRSCRVLAIVADGPSFSVGGDVASFVDSLSGHAPSWFRAGGKVVNSAIARLRRLDAAVIVGAQGHVAGGAFGYMIAGDLVIGADDLKINLAQVRIGASPDAGSTWFLPRLVGHLRAFEILALAETIDASRALALGLINRVVPAADLRASVETMAERLLAVPPLSLKHVKRLLSTSFDTTLETQLHREIEALAEAAGSEAFRRQTKAFIAKRKQLRTPP